MFASFVLFVLGRVSATTYRFWRDGHYVFNVGEDRGFTVEFEVTAAGEQNEFSFSVAVSERVRKILNEFATGDFALTCPGLPLRFVPGVNWKTRARVVVAELEFGKEGGCLNEMQKALESQTKGVKVLADVEKLVYTILDDTFAVNFLYPITLKSIRQIEDTHSEI